jgi:hypothetical protein
MRKKTFLKTSLSLASLLIVSMFGFSAAFGYGGGGGGGGFYVPNCVSVSYGQWGECINGLQYREVINQSPSNCSLSVSQQLDRSRVCQIEEPVVEEEPEPIVEVEPEPIKQVLGERIYAEGTLLRGSDNKIYVVIGNSLYHIRTLKELIKYRGPILNVSDDVIASYSQAQVLGERIYAEGTLLRGSDNKVYVVIGNSLYHIRTLQELAKYRGPILNVSDNVIASYSQAQVLGEKKYADGTLLKAKDDVKIYVIVNGRKNHVRTLDELRNYKGPVLVVDQSELDKY